MRTMTGAPAIGARPVRRDPPAEKLAVAIPSSIWRRVMTRDVSESTGTFGVGGWYAEENGTRHSSKNRKAATIPSAASAARRHIAEFFYHGPREERHHDLVVPRDLVAL